MDILGIARWQFGITTVYHFVMVPLTIGLSVLVAGMQTAWVATGDRRHLAMTKFWGKLLLINFAMGVVTGIVQEFQFGMNWSAYSRFVGDVFGAPLAMEGLVAFFIESTFLGLWIFGWDRLPRRVHLGCAWAFALASSLSAAFIVAANSWMQHPVGVTMIDGRPRLTSIWAVLTNSTALSAIPHTLVGSFAVAAAFLVGIAIWRMARPDRDDGVWRASLKLGALVGVAAFALLFVTGDNQAKLMFRQQPMKMAAAEALCHTETPAGFAVFAIGDVAMPNCDDIRTLDVPGALSFLANGDFTSTVRGVDDLIPQYQADYGTRYPNDPALGALAGAPGDYVPNLPVTYWGFRLMIGLGGLAAFGGAAAAWLTRGGRFPRHRWFPRLALAGIALPYLANAAGWIFTELGRQPFVVAPNPTGDPHLFLFTAQAVSPGVTVGEALTSLIALTAVYLALAGVEAFLMARYVRAGVAGVLPDEPETEPAEHDSVLTFAY